MLYRRQSLDIHNYLYVFFIWKLCFHNLFFITPQETCQQRYWKYLTLKADSCNSKEMNRL